MTSTRNASIVIPNKHEGSQKKREIRDISH